ncbi:MAG TPA: energy transducer TonB [Thermoanaerobaculia bacterium]|nr:energy transducer TonB [Thermoanaerobaculia bacterium]
MRFLVATLVAWLALSALAAPSSYDVRANVAPAGDGRFVIAFEIRGFEQGALTPVASNTVTMRAGKQQVSTPAGPLDLEIDDTGYGSAVLRATLQRYDFVALLEVQAPAGYVRRKMGDGVVAPKPVERVNPIYPDEAKKARVFGAALVDVKISAAGKVEDVRIVRDPGHGLGEAAAEAVRQWRYEPAMKDGQPIAAVVAVTVNFRF